MLRQDAAGRDATVVGWPLGRGPARPRRPAARGSGRGRRRSSGRERARWRRTSRSAASTVWPDEDLPRTHTLKVRKPEVLARLAAMASPGPARRRGTGPDGHRPERRRRPGHRDRRERRRARPGDRADRTPACRRDLNLDSLRRVELLGVIEEELGVFVDDEALDPEATVADLIALIDAAREAKRKPGRGAGRSSPAVRAVGLALQVLLIYPFIHLFYRVRVTGSGSPRRVAGPGAVHAEPLPPPRQRDHPDPAAARRRAGSCRWPRQPRRSTTTRSRASSRR